MRVVLMSERLELLLKMRFFFALCQNTQFQNGRA